MSTRSLTGDGYDITSKNASTVEVESPFSYIMDGHEMTMTSAIDRKLAANYRDVP
jgi:hypothetical protein